MSASIKIVDFEYVKTLRDNKNVLLIDVRDPSELSNNHVIPGSINIPLDNLENVLKSTSPEEFSKQYGRPKPDLKTPLVFSCKSGSRSTKASAIASKLGYENISNYKGGFSDWKQKSR